MRIITINVNGIRAAARKGFFTWLAKQDADIVCLQELKAQEDQLQDDIFLPEGYERYLHCAEKKGYSGVGIYTRHSPQKVIVGLGNKMIDCEGRYLQLDYPTFSVVSLYLPSGSSSDIRQEAKYAFMDVFKDHLEKLKHRKREVFICGDWNIAHKKIDLKNWQSNQKNSGFLPEERAWMDDVFGPVGFHDAFRVIEPSPEHYTWWSNRGRAWEKNVGWRLDYHVITSGMVGRVQQAEIYKAERFSDHAPLTMDYDYTF